MKEVETLVFQRMKNDTVTGGIRNLLGEVVPMTGDPARILHAYQVSVPPSPGVMFSIVSSVAGQVPALTREVFVQFSIFASNHAEIARRLVRLFDRWQHDLSLISGGAQEVGSVSSVFDFEGPDGFDESLEVQKKDLRFRFFVVPKAQAPI